MRTLAGITGLRIAAAFVAGLLVAGCQLLVGAPVPPASQGDAQWGPLTVVEGDFDFDAGAGPGRLNIGRRCVTLRGGGAATTLVWPSARTRWDGASGQIEFDDRDRGPIQIRDGMTVTLGGGDPDVLPDLVWLVPLSPACSEATFLVTQVVIEDQP